MICNVSDATGQLDSPSYRSSVQGRTGFRYSPQGLRLQRCSGVVRDSTVPHLGFLSCRPLSALAPGLEAQVCWIRYGTSSWLTSWPLPWLLWRRPPSVLSHSSRLRTTPCEPPQTPPIVVPVVRQALWERR